MNYEDLPRMTIINFDGAPTYAVPTDNVDLFMLKWNSHGRWTTGPSVVVLEN